MRSNRAAALAGIFFLFGISAASAQKCQLKEIASLDMIDNAIGRVVVPVTVADTPRNMQLDTGGIIGSLGSDVAEELKLERQTLSPRVGIYAATGGKFEYYVTAPSLAIGPSKIENVEFLLTGPNSVPGMTIAGTLAPDILRNFDIDLDFAKKKVNFFSPDHCEGQVVYWAHSYVSVPIKVAPDGHIELETNIDGHDLDTVFDTGASNSTLSLPYAERMLNVDIASPGVTRISSGNSLPVYRTGFKSLSLQGLSVPNPTMELIPDEIYETARQDISDKDRSQPGMDPPHMPELILGIDVIHQLHVYIAYQEHMLYITPAAQ